MKYSKEDVKLKHFNLVIGKDIDYIDIMTEIFNYKNTWLDRKFLFPAKFRGIYKVVEELRVIDVTKQEFETTLKIPDNVDNMSYQARLELSMAMEKTDLQEKVSTVIATACFESQFKRSYDSDSKLFEEFRANILNKPLLEMMAIYNVILHKVNESNEMWNKLFKSVEVIDPYYENVGGSSILGRFSIQSTVKTMIADYGFDYKEVFMQKYILIQSNMWEHQCRAFVNKMMTDAKERDMKRKRNQK